MFKHTEMTSNANFRCQLNVKDRIEIPIQYLIQKVFLKLFNTYLVLLRVQIVKYLTQSWEMKRQWSTSPSIHQLEPSC